MSENVMFLSKFISKRRVFFIFIVNCSHKMRKIVIAFVGYNANSSGDVQRCYQHFILADTKASSRHCTGVPLSTVLFVVSCGVGNVSTIFIGDVNAQFMACLLYTSDAADERSSVDLGGRR